MLCLQNTRKCARNVESVLGLTIRFFTKYTDESLRVLSHFTIFPFSSLCMLEPNPKMSRCPAKTTKPIRLNIKILSRSLVLATNLARLGQESNQLYPFIIFLLPQPKATRSSQLTLPSTARDTHALPNHLERPEDARSSAKKTRSRAVELLSSRIVEGKRIGKKFVAETRVHLREVIVLDECQYFSRVKSLSLSLSLSRRIEGTREDTGRERERGLDSQR